MGPHASTELVNSHATAHLDLREIFAKTILTNVKKLAGASMEGHVRTKLQILYANANPDMRGKGAKMVSHVCSFLIFQFSVVK